MQFIYILCASIFLSATLSANEIPLYWTYDPADPELIASVSAENGITTYFQYDPLTRQVAAELTSDGITISKRRFYEYNDAGKLARMIVDDGHGASVDDPSGARTRYTTTFSYCQEGAACGLLAEIEEKRLSLATGSSYCIQRISNTYDLEGNLQQQLISKGQKNTSHSRLHASKSLSFSEKWNNFMHGLFGRDFLQFAGYYQGTTSSGTFKAGQEMHDKVRVSLINGILNVSADIEAILTKISTTHGDVSVHYVFRPTEGWIRDTWNCTFIKFGYVSEPARLLAQLWKELIRDMGGPDGGGTIVHYAHSIGATDTYAAKDLLSAEELRMIHVVTLGSPSLIPDTAGFGNVANYASRRDGVCLFDPVGYIKGITDNDSNVYFCGPFLGMPEHAVSASSYSDVIDRLGENFVEKYREPFPL